MQWVLSRLNIHICDFWARATCIPFEIWCNLYDNFMTISTTVRSVSTYMTLLEKMVAFFEQTCSCGVIGIRPAVSILICTCFCDLGIRVNCLYTRTSLDVGFINCLLMPKVKDSSRALYLRRIAIYRKSSAVLTSSFGNWNQLTLSGMLFQWWYVPQIHLPRQFSLSLWGLINVTSR